MDYLYQIPRIYEGLEHLLASDPVFKKLDVEIKDLKWPYTGPGFAGLVRIVIGQQVSTAAANSLWARFQEGVPGVTPNAVLALKDDDMRALGLSYQKARYIRGLAEAIRKKEFDPLALERLPDEDVYKAVTALKGFGDWSAEMFLMFGLARPDVWPAGDLGIQEGLKLYLKKKKRPTAEQAQEEGRRFAPHRTAASILLWHLKAVSG